MLEPIEISVWISGIPLPLQNREGLTKTNLQFHLHRLRQNRFSEKLMMPIGQHVRFVHQVGSKGWRDLLALNQTFEYRLDPGLVHQGLGGQEPVVIGMGMTRHFRFSAIQACEPLAKGLQGQRLLFFQVSAMLGVGVLI